MKVHEIRELPEEELAARLAEVKEELFNLRFQNATGQLENYSRLGMLKRDAARIETVLRERLLGIQTAETETPQAKKRRWSGAPGMSEPQAQPEIEEEEEPEASRKKAGEETAEAEEEQQ